MTNLSQIPSRYTSDDLDVFAILESIGRQKKLIFAFALVAGLAGTTLAFLSKPEYKVDSVLRIPELNELDALNRSGVYSLPPRMALIRVGSALDSYDVRRGYFQQHPDFIKAFGGVGASPEQSFAEFNRGALKVSQPEESKDAVGGPVIVELRYPAGVRGDEVLNGFVAYAIDTERKQIARDLKVIIANRLNEIDVKLAAAFAAYEAGKARDIATLQEGDNLKRAELQDELKALRIQMKTSRQDRIKQLDEAIKVARELGLKRPSTPSSMANEAGMAGNVIHTEVNNQQLPLYFMGSDALEAERKVLQQRSSDDFANPRVADIARELALLTTNRKVEVLRQRQDKNEEVYLRDVEPLRAEKARLSTININVDNLHLVSVDQQAFQPRSPIGPRKAIVIGSAILLGGVFGLVVAVLRGIWLNERKQKTRRQMAGHQD